MEKGSSVRQSFSLCSGAALPQASLGAMLGWSCTAYSDV